MRLRVDVENGYRMRENRRANVGERSLRVENFSLARFFQHRQYLRSKLAYAARAERENQIAVARYACDCANCGGKVRRKFHARPLNEFGKPLRCHAGNRLFA